MDPLVERRAHHLLMWCTDPTCDSCDGEGCLENAIADDEPVNGECSCGGWSMLRNLDEYVLAGHATHMRTVQRRAHAQTGSPANASGNRQR